MAVWPGSDDCRLAEGRCDLNLFSTEALVRRMFIISQLCVVLRVTRLCQNEIFYSYFPYLYLLISDPAFADSSPLTVSPSVPQLNPYPPPSSYSPPPPRFSSSFPPLIPPPLPPPGTLAVRAQEDDEVVGEGESVTMGGGGEDEEEEDMEVEDEEEDEPVKVPDIVSQTSKWIV